MHDSLTIAVEFPTAIVHGVNGNIEVDKGTTFTVLLENFPPKAGLEWFADNDHVLDIKAKGQSATITALEAGDSEIEIQHRKRIIWILKIIVRDTGQATGFKVTVGKPVPK